MFDKTNRRVIDLFECALNVVSPSEDDMEAKAATNIRLTLNDLRRIGG